MTRSSTSGMPELSIEFTNEVSKSIDIEPGTTPKQMAAKLHRLAVEIATDSQLKEKEVRYNVFAEGTNEPEASNVKKEFADAMLENFPFLSKVAIGEPEAKTTEDPDNSNEETEIQVFSIRHENMESHLTELLDEIFKGKG